MSNILKREVNIEGSTFKLGDILLQVPDGYKLTMNKGIQYAKKNKKGELIGYDTLSYQSVIISSILKNHDTENEKAELLFINTGQTIIIEKSELYSSGKIIKLADRGMEVNSNNSKLWVDFLSKFEAKNRNILLVKTTINRLGWIDEQTFIPYEMSNFVLDINQSTESWVSALKPKGDILTWIKQMGILRANYIFRFILATSFSAPLLKITDTRSFVIYNWAKSRRRKNCNCLLCNVCMGISREFESFI